MEKKQLTAYEENEIVRLIGDIKHDIYLTQRKILSDANRELIELYFRIGKIVSENQRYGNNFINMLAASLKADFPNTKGFSPRNLSRMRKFYETYGDLTILPPAVAKLPWTHNSILVERVSDPVERVWYAEKCLENEWSKTVLDHQIDLKLYSRQSDKALKMTNFEQRLPAAQGELARALIKDPYIFELSGLSEKSLERDIQSAMMDRIKTVLLEFGRGFSFIGDQYRISTEGNDYFIDMLFYHIQLKCYIVLELKNTDFDPSFVGQLSFYVKAVDKTLKTPSDSPTIGLLLCRNKDRESVQWSLETTSSPVGVASYEISQYLPSQETINDFLK